MRASRWQSETESARSMFGQYRAPRTRLRVPPSAVFWPVNAARHRQPNVLHHVSITPSSLPFLEIFGSTNVPVFFNRKFPIIVALCSLRL
jgi:hypothetical protein